MNCEKFLSKALAYLEVGRLAAASNTDYKNIDDFHDALAYQMFHAIELFYKYMIMKKEGVAPDGHDLKKLDEHYRKIYPNKRHKFVHVFDFSNYQGNSLNLGEMNVYENHIKMFSPKIMSEHLRYPADASRKRSVGGYSFSLESEVYRQLAEDMLRLSAIQE